MADATGLELVALQRRADQDLNIGGSVPRRDRRSDGESDATLMRNQMGYNPSRFHLG
jgi:hypothetical protein